MQNATLTVRELSPSEKEGETKNSRPHISRVQAHPRKTRVLSKVSGRVQPLSLVSACAAHWVRRALERPSLAIACTRSRYVHEALRLSDAYRQPAGLRNAIRPLDWLRTKGKRETFLREIMQLGTRPRQKRQAESGARHKRIRRARVIGRANLPLFPAKR
jgi:hypothetical protein